MQSKPEQLRALSIRQPWAELILRGEKTVEYRSQPTKIRGPIYIYASQANPDGDGQLDSELGGPLSELPRGVIVGTVENVADVLGDDFEPADALQEEWEESPLTIPDTTIPDTTATAEKPAEKPTPAELIKSLRAEAAELTAYKNLAESIRKNAKGDSLLKALRLGFAKAVELGAKPNALIFTESRRTQTYLKGLLEANGYAGKIVLFNGTNTDPESKQVYRDWVTRHAGQECVSGSPTADMRSALVEEFAERAPIMIATESAAEGVNLQFCSLVVNYDLPWSPQRIEQRIGRCHRYGQKHDVVVINFVNRANEADQRVFELLNSKFKLFDGVFGASDEVLGAVESGIDIEKRINDIYKRCRSSDQIREAFDQLQLELSEKISTTYQAARTKLLENFDEDVHHKLRMRQADTQQRLDRYEDWLWALTATELAGQADFDFTNHRFTLREIPDGLTVTGAALGGYRLQPPQDRGGDGDADGNCHYRPGHPLAEAVVLRAKRRTLPPRELRLDYSRRGARVTLVEQLRGQTGWLRVEQLTVNSLDTEETLLISGIAADGRILDRETCDKLLTIPAELGDEVAVDGTTDGQLKSVLQSQARRILDEMESRNATFFDAESDKLDRWTEDRRAALKSELEELDQSIKEAKKSARLAPNLPAKLELQREVRGLETKRDEAWRAYDASSREVDRQKDALLDEIGRRLQQQTSCETLFSLRWRFVLTWRSAAYPPIFRFS